MRQLSVIVGLLALLVACGGGRTGGTMTTEVFRPNSPLAAGVYVQISGPSPVVRNLGNDFRHDKQLGGVVMVRKAHGPEDCTVTETIPNDPKAAPRLRKYVGQKLTIWIYGKNRFTPRLCHGLRRATRVG